MQRYKCHKEVEAAKINSITFSNNTVELRFDNADPVNVPRSWADKHKPFCGGYFVVYKDGYQSYSPAEAFEEGYTKI